MTVVGGFFQCLFNVLFDN